MKSNAYMSILLGVFAAMTIFSLVMCAWYILALRQARILQGQLVFRQAAVRQVVEETAEYARRTNSKEAVQILESVGIKLAPTNPAAATANPK